MTSEPSKDPYIVFGSPSIGAEEIAAVSRTLESLWIGTGPRVHEFERAFARMVGVDHALATSSCTAALHLAMAASGVGAGDEVITTAMTFCATANAIVHTGATPVLVDCQRDTMNIDPAAVEAAITPRTRALVPVHFAGRPVDMRALRKIADKYGLLIIEDAAHAIEAVYHGKRAGGLGDIGCFSFYVTKNMTTGEGGMVTTNDAKLAERVRIYGLHGMSADAWSRFSDQGFKHYEVVVSGFKYNLTDLAASLGLVQLPKLVGWHARREELWARYDSAFADLPLVLPKAPDAETVHARHLYTVLVRDDAAVTRDQFMAQMHKRGVGTGVHYRALNGQRFYRERWGYRPDDMPNATYIGERTVSIPLTPRLTELQVERVIDATRAVASGQG